MQIGWLLLLDSQRDGTCPDDELEGTESCGEETGDGDEGCDGPEDKPWYAAMRHLLS